jgi:enolase-phosphatase E1
MRKPAAVVTDIEGTTTRISFVHDVLFPYARARLPQFLAARGAEPAVAAAIEDVRQLAPNAPPLTTLLGWMDADEKITPLKTLQGLIWAEGYGTDALRGELYADVAPALRCWYAGGVRLYVYSSGSEAAQKQLFGHTQDGDLTELFSGFYDTRVGAKREAASYQAIATAIGVAAADILFLSDVAAELDAAAASGWQVCQLVRPQDGTAPAPAHPRAATFDEVSAKFGLPA